MRLEDLMCSTEPLTAHEKANLRATTDGARARGHFPRTGNDVLDIDIVNATPRLYQRRLDTGQDQELDFGNILLRVTDKMAQLVVTDPSEELEEQIIESGRSFRFVRS